MLVSKNYILFDDKQRKALKSLIDKKYGKITTTIDYESTSNIYDLGIEGTIYKETGERISGSTVERIVGLTSENRKTNIQSIKVIAKYLGFADYEVLLNFLEKSGFDTLSEKRSFDPLIFLRNNSLEIRFKSGNQILIQMLENNMFVVKNQVGTKLHTGDKIEINTLKVNEEFILNYVLRNKNKEIINLGLYKTGYFNPVVEIRVIP